MAANVTLNGTLGTLAEGQFLPFGAEFDINVGECGDNLLTLRESIKSMPSCVEWLWCETMCNCYLRTINAGCVAGGANSTGCDDSN